jgi:YihY family inner membrane protein
MSDLHQPASLPWRHPLAFLWEAAKQFRAAQGLLLAGAVAYYALLSIVPLLIVSVIVLSRFVDQSALLATIGRYLEWLLPGQSRAIVAELANFLAHRDVLGPVLLVTMIFFSSLAFTVLESAMAVLFHHRKSERSRHFLVSAVMPYLYIFSLGFGLLLVTLVSGVLQIVGQESVELFGHAWSLSGVSGFLLYLLGLGGEIFMLTSLYMVMPVGHLSLRHALPGGVTAALLWEITRHALVWYFATLSQVNVVYGSLTTAIVVLLSLEIAATLVLFGAQVIAQYERLDRTGRLRASSPPTL